MQRVWVGYISCSIWRPTSALIQHPGLLGWWMPWAKELILAADAIDELGSGLSSEGGGHSGHDDKH